MGITKLGEETIKNSEKCTYGIYLNYKNGTYDNSDIQKNPISTGVKLIIPGTGYVQFSCELQMVEGGKK